jgi:holo-ACP synthase CitX
MEILRQVLDGREERAHFQQGLLKESGLVVQIALNVPGFPKRLEGDEKALLEAMGLFCAAFGPEGKSVCPSRLDNGAGLAYLLAYRGRDPLEAKRCAIDVETGRPWGRALDMDILTPSGGLSRHDLGLPPRSCLVCGREAKVCSRLGTHDIKELRQVLADMLLGFR